MTRRGIQSDDGVGVRGRRSHAARRRVGSLASNGSSASVLQLIDEVLARRPPDAKRTLVSVLAHSDAEVRLRGAEALGILLRGSQAPSALMRLLSSDPDRLVRAEAADSLSAIGDARARHALRTAIHDRSPIVRAYAARSIGELGNPRDTTVLRAQLNIEKDASARVALIWAIHTLGRYHLLPELLAALSHRNYRVRCLTANLIEASQLTREERTAAVAALRVAMDREEQTAALSSMTTAFRAIRAKRSH